MFTIRRFLLASNAKLIEIVKAEHDDGRRAEHAWSRATGGCCDNSSSFVITKTRVVSRENHLSQLLQHRSTYLPETKSFQLKHWTWNSYVFPIFCRRRLIANFTPKQLNARRLLSVPFDCCSWHCSVGAIWLNELRMYGGRVCCSRICWIMWGFAAWVTLFPPTFIHTSNRGSSKTTNRNFYLSPISSFID